MLLAAAGAIAAAIFGDQALDIAREAGVPMAQMEGHEELGTLSAWLLAGMAALNTFFFRKQSMSKPLSLAVLFGGIVLLILLLTTAWFGGQLVYELGINVRA